MKTFYSPLHEWHNPIYEGYSGIELLPAFEEVKRAHKVHAALQQTSWAKILPPANFGLEPILEIHSPRYIEYLRSAYQNWIGHSPIEGLAFIPGTFGIDYQQVQLLNGNEKSGFFLMDTTVSVTPGTFSAALEATHCALSGAESLSQGERAAFALSRPPGHHAGSEVCGGYCFFNNAAIAAQWLSRLGKIAILDVDYHAGNGTQDIFYARPEILTISLHADPAEEYPRYAGYAHETGTGPGSGFHHNFPLPAGTRISAYLTALDKALKIIADFAPRYLVISAGMDTYKDEPLGTFGLDTGDLHQVGQTLAGLSLPTLIVMEGGYHLPSLGDNFVAFLEPFA